MLTLFCKNKEKLIDCLKKVPIGKIEKETELKLTMGHSHRNGDEVAEGFGAIPANFTLFSLRNNGLGLKSSDYLVEIFQALPSHIIILDLELNFLAEKLKGANLAKVFRAIPHTVKVLNLWCNFVETMCVEEMNELSNSLPHIETIYLQLGQILLKPLQYGKALMAIFPNVKTVIFDETEFKDYQRDNNYLKKLQAVVEKLPFEVLRCLRPEVFEKKTLGDKTVSANTSLEYQEEENLSDNITLVKQKYVLPVSPLSLFNITSRKVKEMDVNIEEANISEDLKEYLEQFTFNKDDEPVTPVHKFI